MTYLVYVRRSYRTANDADVSDEAQAAAAIAMLPPGAPYEVIADSGGHHSGRSDDRDGLRELTRRIEAGSCAGVAVYDLSRLFRSSRLLLNFHHALERAGIPLLVAMLPGSRFDTAAGRLLLSTMAGAAQYQADMDSERARDLRRSLFEDGYHRGQPPFGYRNGRSDNRRILEPDEVTAPIVARIFEELGSRSYADIATTLRLEGLPAPSRRGWSRYSVREVHLRERIYLGMVVRGDEERPGRHQPIITPELADAARLGARVRDKGGRKSAPGRAYLLTGVLRCDCGYGMVGHWGRSRGYYVCRTCDLPGIRTDDLDDLVLGAIRGVRVARSVVMLLRELLRESLAVPKSDETAKQRRRLEGVLANLRKQHSWGDIDDATYRRERREVEEMLAGLRDDDKLVTFDDYRSRVFSAAEELEKMSTAERKDLVRLFVESVTRDGTIEWAGPVRPFFERSVSVSPEGSDLAESLRWYTRGVG
jgi:DNA invertase Pin-like site-specific DNA recombinase